MGVRCDRIYFGGWRPLSLSWRSWAASGISGERQLHVGAGPQRDAVVPFGNLPGARRQAWTEFHPVASGLGEGTRNRVAKDVRTGCWWLVLAERVGITVYITWLGSGVLG